MSFLRSRTASAPDGIGKPVRRREDARLVAGAGRYTDDVSLPGQAYAAFVRSPHAHARIRAIDARAALAVPGVLTVLTDADAVADGVKALPHRPIPTNPHEVPLTSPDDAPSSSRRRRNGSGGLFTWGGSERPPSPPASAPAA